MSEEIKKNEEMKNDKCIVPEGPKAEEQKASKPKFMSKEWRKQKFSDENVGKVVKGAVIATGGFVVGAVVDHLVFGKKRADDDDTIETEFVEEDE